jgi:hypothetical protein
VELLPQEFEVHYLEEMKRDKGSDVLSINTPIKAKKIRAEDVNLEPGGSLCKPDRMCSGLDDTRVNGDLRSSFGAGQGPCPSKRKLPENGAESHPSAAC